MSTSNALQLYIMGCLSDMLTFIGVCVFRIYTPLDVLFRPRRMKPCLRGLRITQAQTSMRIRAVWSAPLLVLYLDLLERNFNFLYSLWSWGDWFVSGNVGNPVARFCRDKTDLIRPLLGSAHYWNIRIIFRDSHLNMLVFMFPLRV